LRSCVKASRPPAEAPMQTIVKGKLAGCFSPFSPSDSDVAEIFDGSSVLAIDSLAGA